MIDIIKQLTGALAADDAWGISRLCEAIDQQFNVIGMQREMVMDGLTIRMNEEKAEVRRFEAKHGPVTPSTGGQKSSVAMKASQDELAVQELLVELQAQMAT